MAGTPLDLMALPRVAIEKSLSSMTPNDLLKLSRASEHCKNIIKSIKFNVGLSFYETDLNVYWAQSRRNWSSETIKIGEREEEAELRDAVTEITSLYRTSLAHFRLDTKDFENTWKWLKEEQKGLESINLTMKNEEDPGKVIRALLENSELGKLNNLEFNITNIPASFKFEDPFVFKNPPKELWIFNSSWFTVQHLMDSKVETCHLFDPTLTNEDINLMLKQWINDNGPLSNLESIRMYRNGIINENVAFNGLQIAERWVGIRDNIIVKITCGKDFYLDLTYADGEFSCEKESGDSDGSEEAEDSDSADEA